MTQSSPIWKQRLRHYWAIIPLAVIMLLLAIPELENIGFSPWNSDPCALQEIDQGGFASKLYVPITKWALRYTPTPNVAIIYIDPKTEPAEILTNTCAARVFLSSLIRDLNILHANLIVIDKYYSAQSCTEDQPNSIFRAVTAASAIPIVVGQPTQKLSDTPSSGGCLALVDHFDFGTNKVHYGLTRLNSDTLKIPLTWPVYKESTNSRPAEDTTPHIGDSIALVAARQQDPNIDNNTSLQRLLAKGLHPYTTFLDLPHINAMIALCSAEPNPKDVYGNPFNCNSTGDCKEKTVRSVSNLDCNNLNLSGKIVVIGDKAEQDMQPYPGGEDQPGVWLQANYVQSLLDHRFLREIPITLTVACLVAFITVVYCLFWFIEKPERALLINTIILAVLILICLGVLVTTSFFTPLWALWGAGLVVIFRYLETRAHFFSTQLKREPAEPSK